MRKGMSLSNLLITVVRKPDGEGHAVLTVRTDKGDFVLDNLTDAVRQWDATGYRFLKRQATDHTGRWVTIREGQRAAGRLGQVATFRHSGSAPIGIALQRKPQCCAACEADEPPLRRLRLPACRNSRYAACAMPLARRCDRKSPRRDGCGRPSRAVEIGERARDLQHAVIGARRKAELFAGVAQQRQPGGVGRGDLLDQRRRAMRVGRD